MPPDAGSHPQLSPAAALIRAAERLARGAGRLRFSSPVALVYNPLDYAARAHAEYIGRFARTPKRVLFLGMNPGPWGMAQTGVPFGDVPTVRDWMGIEAPIGKPRVEHPARPVEGLACARVEVSGSRLWGLARERFGTPAAFFRHHFVANYCPLIFLEESGRNRTPDRLPRAERDALYAVCDEHLRALLDQLEPRWIVGVGRFAFGRLQAVLGSGRWKGATAALIPHPSPASPRANAGWAADAERALEEAGVW